MEAVVDANVLIHGRGNYPFDRALTVQGVVDELESDHSRNMLRNISYEVRQPSDDALEKVKDKSEDLNSPTSENDEELLALALETGEVLLTDDLALQNLALHLDVEFNGFLEDEISEKFCWEIVCENCGKEVAGKKCPGCGSTLLRRKQVRCS